MTSALCRLHGRTGSHYTRVARIFALEAGVELAFSPTPLTSTDPGAYGGHPALKLPLLEVGDQRLIGTENICRRIVALAARPPRVAWPEDLPSPLAANAQELVWQAMQAQVQLVLGVQVSGLPADNLYFVKARAGLDGALTWLNSTLPDVLAVLPARDLSLLETTLYCLLEHLRFRPSTELTAYRRLEAFRRDFSQRASAQATPFVLDAPAAR